MKKEKYFSVQEFAKMVGVSRQTVYNSKRLKPYVKVINGHKWVDKEALRFYEKNNSDKEENVNDTVKALQKQYNKLYKELEELRQYKADREEQDEKILVALERAKHERNVKEILLEQKEKDDKLIQNLMEQNRKQNEMILEQNRTQAKLLEQVNILKALELKK